MDAKSKIPNSKLLEQWWQHSQIFLLKAQIAGWREGSKLLRIEGLAALLLLVIVTLPYLENNQTGLIAAAIAIFWVLLWLSDRRDNAISSWTPIHLPVLVYWCIAGVATILSPVKRLALDGWVKLTIFLILFVVLNRVLRLSKLRGSSPEQKGAVDWRSLFVGTYLLTTLAVCVYGLRQWFFGAEPLATWTDPTSELAGTTRIYSFLNNPNLLGGYLLPSLPLSVAAVFQWRSWGARTVAVIVGISSIFCIRETYSRGALYGLYLEILVLVILLAYWWGARLPKWSIPSFIGGAIGLLALNLLVPAQRSRLLSSFGERADSSSMFRRTVWGSVLEMIKAHPILGIGPGNKAFNQIYPYYQRPGFSALGTYSVPLEITVETGIIGAICYGWLVITTVQQGWRQLNRLRASLAPEGLWIIAALSMMAGLMAHGLVDTVWYRPQVQILWWLAIALIASFCGQQAEILDRETASDSQ